MTKVLVSGFGWVYVVVVIDWYEVSANLLYGCERFKALGQMW
jgi:hypothetical protein